ncbi:ABC transporter permease [Xylanibacillus composti]|nr:ABC transporter permease [Xylanibacillus composti]
MRAFLYKWWPPALVLALLLIGWQAAVDISGVEKWHVPSPVDVAQEWVKSYPQVLAHTWVTVKVMLAGTSIGIIVGIAGALLLHVSPFMNRAFYPLMILSQNIPIIVLSMLLIFWFGFGLTPKIVIIVLVCFFPVLVATMNGLAQTDRSMRSYMLMTGATRMQLLFKLELPYSLPYLFAGVKIAATYSVMGAVIAEWVGGSQGIGKFMMLSYASFRMDRVFVSVMVIIVLSLLMVGLSRLLEWRFTRWKASSLARGNQGGDRP